MARIIFSFLPMLILASIPISVCAQLNPDFVALVERHRSNPLSSEARQLQDRIVELTSDNIEVHRYLGQFLDSDDPEWIVSIFVRLQTPYVEIQKRIIQAVLFREVLAARYFLTTFINEGVFTAEAEMFLATRTVPSSANNGDMALARKATLLVAEISEHAPLRPATLQVMEHLLSSVTSATDESEQMRIGAAKSIFYSALRDRDFRRAELMFERILLSSNDFSKANFLIGFNYHLSGGSINLTAKTEALKFIARDKVFALILNCLKSPNSRIRHAATLIFASMGPAASRGESSFHDLLSHPTPGVRVSAAAILIPLARDRAILDRIIEVILRALPPSFERQDLTEAALRTLGDAMERMCNLHGINSLSPKSLHVMIKYLDLLPVNAALPEEDQTGFLIQWEAIRAFERIILASLPSLTVKLFVDRDTRNTSMGAMETAVMKIFELSRAAHRHIKTQAERTIKNIQDPLFFQIEMGFCESALKRFRSPTQ